MGDEDGDTEDVVVVGEGTLRMRGGGEDEIGGGELLPDWKMRENGPED